MADLTTKALAQEWKKGGFRPVYYLFGEDAPAKTLAVKALREALNPDAFNLSEFQGDDDARAGEIASACATPPMFSERRLVIVRNARFGAAARRVLADYLREPLESTTLCLVSAERKPDAKDALAAAARSLGGIVVFKPLTHGEAAARLCEEARRAGFRLEPQAAEFMIEEAGSEWGILRAELKKLALYIRDRKAAGLEDVAACLGYRQQANPFDLPRSLQKRDAVRSLGLLRRLLVEGDEPFRLLYQITQTVNKQLKAKRLAQSGLTPDRIFRQLRLNSYYDRDYMAVAGRLSEASLIRALRACVRTEADLKSKTWLSPAVELEALVLKVCGKA
ncbi:MAG: DNA polymerase III subunit delta [Elusimicrobiota bacterium]